MKLLLIPILLILLSSVVFSLNDTATKTYCYYSQETVCGTDGQNYQNSCIAELNKVQYTQGACQKQIISGIDNNTWLIIALLISLLWYFKNK